MRAIVCAGVVIAASAPVRAESWAPEEWWVSWVASQVEAPRSRGRLAVDARTHVVVDSAEFREEMDEAVIQSLVCLGSGAAGMAATAATGPVNIINVIAGGLVTPLNQAAVYLSLVGVVFATFCSVGQAATPAALYVYEQLFKRPKGPAADFAKPARLGDERDPIGLVPPAPLRRTLPVPVGFELVRER